MPKEVLENAESGFGLTLVEGYAEQFDGAMELSEADEGGTCVTVTLELEELMGNVESSAG